MNLKNLKEPFVIVLIGPPMSGKTTWIKQNFPTTNVISRDDIVMEVYGSKNYTEAFKNVDLQQLSGNWYNAYMDVDALQGYTPRCPKMNIALAPGTQTVVNKN